MRQLEINLKFTAKQYPQAKGKVEKRFDYFQRRLPLLMERYKVTSLTKANEILREQVDYFNSQHIHNDTKEIPDARWNKALKEGRTYFRPLSKEIARDWIFSLHYPRKVKSTGSVTFAGKEIYVAQAPRGKQVTLMLRPPDPRRSHTEIFIVYQNKTLKHLVIPTSARDPFHKSKSMRSLLHSAMQLALSPMPKQISKEDILGNIGSVKK